MIDIVKRLRKDAERLDGMAERERGTLRAYWKGMAEGLRVASRIRSDYEARAWMSEIATFNRRDESKESGQ